MKQDFRTRITRLAEEIAGVKKEADVNAPSPDASKVAEILSSITRLEAPFKAIDKASEAKDVIIHIMNMMTKMSDADKRSGLNAALTKMAKDAVASKGQDGKGMDAPDNVDLPELK